MSEASSPVETMAAAVCVVIWSAVDCGRDVGKRDLLIADRRNGARRREKLS